MKIATHETPSGMASSQHSSFYDPHKFSYQLFAPITIANVNDWFQSYFNISEKFELKISFGMKTHPVAVWGILTVTKMGMREECCVPRVNRNFLSVSIYRDYTWYQSLSIIHNILSKKCKENVAIMAGRHHTHLLYRFNPNSLLLIN